MVNFLPTMTTAFALAILAVTAAVVAGLAYDLHAIDAADADDEDDDQYVAAQPEPSTSPAEHRRA